MIKRSLLLRCTLRKFGVDQGPKLWNICRKNDDNKPRIDLVNINAYINFGETQSICSQDIEQKQNYDE